MMPEIIVSFKIIYTCTLKSYIFEVLVFKFFLMTNYRKREGWYSRYLYKSGALNMLYDNYAHLIQTIKALTFL